MAKWDHADLLSVDAKAVLYPEYTDLESLKRYNPDWLLTDEGKKHWPNYVPRPYGGREDKRRKVMEIDPGYGWDADTQKLEQQLQDLRDPPEKRLAEIEKRRQKHRNKLRKEIRKLGGEPVL